MKRSSLLAVSALLFTALYSFGADSAREWQSGTLLETEKQQVHQGSTTVKNTDGTVKDTGKKADYSQTTTSHTNEDYDTFQVYTIQGDTKTYIAREKLLFPWSKPANVTVGGKVKYSIQKNTLYLLDEDDKRHKAGISKVTMNPAH